MERFYKLFYVTMLALFVSTSVFAYDCEVDGIYYNRLSVDEFEVTFGGYNQSGYRVKYTGDIVIPETVTYRDKLFKVTKIDYMAFKECSALTSISIPQSITILPDHCFYGCSSLSSISIPQSMKTIGVGVFYECKALSNVILPEGITSINNKLFYGCEQLESITIPQTTTSIGESAFEGCIGMTTITLPEQLSSIGKCAFKNCSGLLAIHLPEEALSLGENVFENCSSLNAVILPSNFIYIPKNAFLNCKRLEQINLPDKMWVIDDYAFMNCVSLEKISVPSVARIGLGAYRNCTSLKKVIVNDIDAWCGIDFVSQDSNPLFYAQHLYSDEDTEIKTLVIGSRKIGDYAFYKAENITSIYMIGDGSKIPEISDHTFGNTCYTWTDLYVPEGKKEEFSNADYWRNFKSISESDFCVETNGIRCRIKNSNEAEVIKPANGESYFGDIVIPESVSFAGANIKITSIGEWAFDRCSSLTSVTIPDGVTSIGERAFSGCTGLTSVYISNSITDIGYYAFAGCIGLTSVYISDIVAWCKIRFYEDSSNPLYYAHHLYLKGEEIKGLEIPNEVTSIGSHTFCGWSGLTSVTFHNSVVSIGNSAFKYCSGLTSVNIPNSVTGIYHNAFLGCTSLTSIIVEKGNSRYDSRNNCNAIIETENNTLITGCKMSFIPDDVTNIGYEAFCQCSGLTSITIPNSVTSIGHSAFYQCSGLTSLNIPNSVTSIGPWAFGYCNGLTSVNIPNRVTYIMAGTFYGCSGLIFVDLPNSITSIGEYAFRDCIGLGSIIIPSAVTNIGYDAFLGCTKLISVKSLNDKAPTLGDRAFSIVYNATLQIPENSETSYINAGYAYYFKNIVEFDPSGIQGITMDKSIKSPVYDLNGRRLKKPSKGINIIGGKKVLKH